MKKLFCILLALLMVLSMSAPALADESHSITSEVFPTYFDGVDIGAPIALYFLNGEKDLPYLEVHDLCDLLNGLVGDGGVTVGFEIKTEEPVVTITRRHEGGRDDGTIVTFDFDKSEIRFMDYNLFTMPRSNSSILDMTGIKYINDKGESLVMQKVDRGTFDRYGDELVLPLADYGIELVYQPVEDGLYLIPLQTFSDFFLAPTLSRCAFYNGQYINLIGAIKPGDELYYAAPTGERSEALAKFGYSELCMMLDYLYGLKEVHEIDSFAQLFHQVGFEGLLQGPEAAQADAAIYRLITDYFDDGHSKLYAFSYLTGSLDYEAPLGPSETKWNDQNELYTSARAKFYPDGIPGYEEVGNTAYITFDEFTQPYADVEQYYQAEDAADLDDSDTIALIMKAHAMINRENSPIENVVLDLSCNYGGTSYAAEFVIAWFLGEASVGVKDTMTGAVSASTYRCDANRDRQYDEGDTLAGKRLFCLSSPVSFSCGNLLPCALKASDMVTILGRTSGGGSCVVQNISSAWGTSFRISGSKRLSFIKNGSYYDIDRGTDPDFIITSPEKYYDRQDLTDYINSLY